MPGLTLRCIGIPFEGKQWGRNTPSHFMVQQQQQTTKPLLTCLGYLALLLIGDTHKKKL